MTLLSTPAARHVWFLVAALAAGAAAYAVNLAPFFGLARLWPGRLLTLPIAIVLGPWYGALTAALSAPGAYRFTTLHLIVFVLEAMLVGAIARRRRSVLPAGALFWLAYFLTFVIAPRPVSRDPGSMAAGSRAPAPADRGHCPRPLGVPGAGVRETAHGRRSGARAADAT
jgi:hypothetical protein